MTDRGPLRTYEVTWRNGYAERVQGHQVTVPHVYSFNAAVERKILIHGEFDGHWRLVLAVDGDMIAAVRDVTDGEVLTS